MLRLGPDVHLIMWNDVVDAFRVCQQSVTFRILQDEGVAFAGCGVGDLVLPGDGGVQRGGFLEHGLVAVRDNNGCVGDGVICIEGNLEGGLTVALRLALERDDAIQCGPHDGADAADGHPELREAHRLPRFKKAEGSLILKEAGLHFEIGAVIVRKPVAPHETIAVQAPDEDLLGGHLFGVCPVDDA